MLQANLTGRTIGDFRLDERIGRGGMAAVYRAFQGSVNRDVAFKVISLDPDYDLGNQQEFEQRFAQEASVVASLEHIHILPIYSYGVLKDDVAYLAMRLLRGGTLEDRLKDGALGLEEAVTVFTQVARGLQYAHTKGVIHRDLKPSNILFDEANNAYLADFGLAKVVEKSLNLTQAGMLVGTPAYISPEQLLDNHIIDHRADIYSMGVLLYHMLVGHPPFEMAEGGIGALIKKHTEEMPVLPSNLNPAIPPEVEAIILCALQKDPHARFTSVEDMTCALNEAIGRKWTTSSTGHMPRLQAPRVSSRRWKLGVAGALVVLAVIAGIFLAAHQSAPSAPHATVLEDAHGNIPDVAVTDAEIAQARALIGDGFIGLISCNLTTETNAVRARVINDTMNARGLPMRLYDANSDRTRIPGLIEQAVAEGARGLIICPFDAAAVDAPLRELQARNFPLVLVSILDTSYGGVTINWNNARLGEEAAQYAAQLINTEHGGSARVLILDMPSLPGIQERVAAMEAALRADAPNAEIVGRYDGASTRDQSRTVVADLLQQGLEFDVVLAINDASALGAADALDAAGVDPSAVAVIGINGETIARDYVERGWYFRATVPIDIMANAEASVNALIKLITGGTVPEYVLIPPAPIITRETLPATS